MATSDITNPYEQIWKSRDLRALNTPVEIDNKLPEWRRGLGAFGKEMQATGYGLVALGSQGLENVIGENEVTSGVTDWGLKGYDKSIKESQSGLNAPSVARIEDIKNASDAMDWAGYQLGKGIPMLGSLALSGGVGGAIARVSASAGVKALAKSAVGSTVKKAVATKALQAAEGQVVTQAMKQAAAQSLRDTFTKGAIAGGFAGSFGLEGGLAFGEQAAEGVNPADAVKSAIAVGGINGALEFLPFYSAAKSIGMGSYAKKAIANVIAENPELSKRAIGLAKEIGGRAAKGAAVGAGAEGVTEGLQELVSIAGLRWAENEPLFADLTPEDWGRIKNAAASGALVGGAAMGAGATLGGPQEGVTPPPAETVTPTTTPVSSANQTRVQTLEAAREKINTELETARASGDTAKVNELQQVKELYDAELGTPPAQEIPTQEASVQEPPAQEIPIETPPVIQTVPPVKEVTPPVQETPLDIPQPESATEQPPVVPPVTARPGETIQLKRGEEVILTPPGQPETRVVPTEEEKANLQQLLRERLTVPITQPEVIPNAEEVQTQTEAPVDTKYSMPRRQPKAVDVADVSKIAREPANNVISNITFGKQTLVSKVDNVATRTTARGKKYDFNLYEYDLPDGRKRLVLSAGNPENYVDAGAVIRFENNKPIVEMINADDNFENLGYNLARQIVKKFGVPVKDESGSFSEIGAKHNAKLTSAKEELGFATEATMEEFEAIRKQFQERQQQETPFKNWFGKGTPGVTTDSAGEPITLYHGTNNPVFNEWDSSRAGESSSHPTSGLGFFMTADKGAAARYGNNLMALHAKIQNPYELTDADLTSIETKEDAAKLRKKLMAKGYDGAVVKAPGAKPYVIAFDSKQVKFVTNEKPTDSKDFRYSMPKIDDVQTDVEEIPTHSVDVIPEAQELAVEEPLSSRATKTTSTQPITPDELRANINSVMGENWIQQAEAAGVVEVIDGAGTRGESGSWAGDKFRLYTQTMPADGSPLGVLLHEGSHAPTFNEILGDSLAGYLKDLDTLADNGNQTARNAIAQATIAVADVLGIKHNLMQGGNKADFKNIQALIEERRPGLLAEEKLAYFIQYGSETKDGAGFLKRLINAIKAWFAQTQLGQALKNAGIGFEINEAMAVEWAKASLRNSLAEAQQAARVRELAIAAAKQMPPSVRLGRALEAQYSIAPEATLQDFPKDSLTDSDIRYSLGLQEFKDTLWTDPTDSRQDFVNKPGLLQKFRANFIDFFAEIEKKSTQVYDAYSLLRNKKAARLVQARQEYMFPLRDLIAKSSWTSKEVGDMLAARHIKVDKVNTRLAERASYNYTKELLKSLPDSKRKELMKARSNVKGGMMPDGSAYKDTNGNLAKMSKETKQKLMFDLMNKYVEFEQPNSDGKQALRFEWEVFKDAAGGFSNGGVGKGVVRSVDDVLAGTSKDQAKFDKIASLFDAMNRHALQIREDGELITPAEHARLLLDKTAYAPLRRESYNVDREIEQLFRYAGQGGSKQLGVRTGTVALSEPTLVLQNALAALEASAAAAERNLANKELYKVVNADKEAWKPWFTIVDADKYATHDEDGFLQEKNATASNRADITLINNGKKLVIRPNMHNERAIGFVRAVNNLDSQVISGPMSVLNFFNNIVRWVNVTASPAFLMMNAIRDPGTAFYNMQATEAAPYTSEIFANYRKSFKALKKVFLDGNRDPTDADVQMVERFENAGGRTSFIEQLNPSDDTWRSFDAQVARRQGNLKQVMAAKDKWIDGLENFNVLFENVMRLSTFNVLVDKGTSETKAARIAQDLTTNFTRRGYKTQALGNWWVFFNAAVQGNYQVVRNLLASKKLQAWAGGTIVFALMLDLLGRAVADDWDEIPEWDKERFIILPVKVAGDFVKIPAPWVYNVLWRAGGMFGEMFSGVRKPQDMVLDLAALTATTFNPLGKPGSIAQAIAPTAADPFVQILENKDFAGNPIGPEGIPGASSKANSELLWSSTPKGYQSVARFVNELTGGSAVESGAIDLRPGDYQLLAKFLTGSLGRFLSDATFGLKENLEEGIEGPKEIPVVKEFFSEPYNPMRSQTYHTNIASVYGAHKLEKMYREGTDRDLVKLHEVRKERNKDLRMYNQAQDVERQIKSLRVRIRAAENRNDNARVKALRGRIEEIQERFNTAYKQKVS